MSQWGFYFNQDRCIGCKACVTSCKNWNENRRGDAELNTVSLVNVDTDNDTLLFDGKSVTVEVGAGENGANYIEPASGRTNYALFRKYNMKEDWRRLTTHETGVVTETANGALVNSLERRFLSLSCNHCSNPACLAVCPTGNITKDRDTGIVLAGGACISCGKCRNACPWDAPQFYAPNFGEYALGDESRPLMTKCTLCLDRIRDNLRPACVAACWNRALDAGSIEDLKAKYPNETTDDFNDDYVAGLGIHTEPNIIFKKKVKQVFYS